VGLEEPGSAEVGGVSARVRVTVGVGGGVRGEQVATRDHTRGEAA
jgi:hypothetical protein